MSRSARPTSASSPAGRKSPLGAGRLWWFATRPATLAASVAPVLLGTAFAVHDGHVRTGAGLLALLVALALQVGVNYSNDYSDFKRGADTPERVGPPRAAASGVVPPSQVRAAAIGAFAIAAVAGLVLSLTTDPRLLLLGAACVLAGWLYTGGPRPYGYVGLGELFVFVFFGLVAVVGTVYVNELRIPAPAWLGGAACGFVASAVLGINNLRDIESDQAAGKRTLAVRIGAAAARRLIVALAILACLCVVTSAAVAGQVTQLLGLAAIPVLIAAISASGATDPRTLIDGLRRMAAAELVLALFWTLGLLL